MRSDIILFVLDVIIFLLTVLVGASTVLSLYRIWVLYLVYCASDLFGIGRYSTFALSNCRSFPNSFFCGNCHVLFSFISELFCPFAECK